MRSASRTLYVSMCVRISSPSPFFLAAENCIHAYFDSSGVAFFRLRYSGRPKSGEFVSPSTKGGVNSAVYIYLVPELPGHGYAYEMYISYLPGTFVSSYNDVTYVSSLF